MFQPPLAVSDQTQVEKVVKTVVEKAFIEHRKLVRSIISAELKAQFKELDAKLATSTINQGPPVSEPTSPSPKHSKRATIAPDVHEGVVVDSRNALRRMGSFSVAANSKKRRRGKNEKMQELDKIKDEIMSIKKLDEPNDEAHVQQVTDDGASNEFLAQLKALCERYPEADPTILADSMAFGKALAGLTPPSKDTEAVPAAAAETFDNVSQTTNETVRALVVVQESPAPEDGDATAALLREMKDDAVFVFAATDNTCSSRLDYLVHSRLFENLMMCLVCLNVMFVGYETNERAVAHGSGQLTKVSELVFCVIFSTELLLRILAEAPYNFFFGRTEMIYWNYFDTILVLLQITEQVLLAISSKSMQNFQVLRLVRLLRILRVTRALRMLHLSEILQSAWVSISSAVVPALTAFSVFVIFIYVFSVLLMQVLITEDKDALHESSDISHYFPDLMRTFLTMFECLVGGVDWEIVITPLIAEISPWAGFFFTLYICTGLFVILNLLVTVMADRIGRSLREDKDQVLLSRFHSIFAADEQVTWEKFASKLTEDAVIDYFLSIDIVPTPGQAKRLFELLDVDNSGSVDSESLVASCLRLRGPSRALDMVLLMRDVCTLREQTHTMAFKNDRVFKMMEEFKSVRDMLERFMLAQWKDTQDARSNASEDIALQGFESHSLPLD